LPSTLGDRESIQERGMAMRRLSGFRASRAVAVAAAVVAVLAVRFPGLGIGQTSTSHGVTPSDVYTTTDPGICADVDTFGQAPILPTNVTVAASSNLLVYFASEVSGLLADTELLLTFRVNDDAGNEVAQMGEWGVSNDPRLNDSKTIMWSFDNVEPGAYDVFVDARTDPVPGPPGGGNTNNNPSATLEHCALTVFVIPVG
jgi:hypothetical protein